MNNLDFFFGINVARAVGEYTISCDVECEVPPYHEKMSVEGFTLRVDSGPGFEI